jgi:dissimilatory sulfite reductase (desulfoviridin) alpha/beta subunit
MKWTPEAEDAIQKVPFFVRKRVRARVVEEARQAGKSSVTLADVKASQKRYLSGMAAEVKGYQFDVCFGPSGCPHQIQPDDNLSAKIEQLLQSADLLAFLKSKGIVDLKFHHELRVTLANCPNACSQPQIKDIGIIAALLPAIGDVRCSGCEACTATCREAAITLGIGDSKPVISTDLCVACGQCIPVCPTGTIVEAAKGYRVQLGGKLGRHPQLARELPGIYTQEAVLGIVADCIDLYKARSRRGERFGELIGPEDIQALAQRHAAFNLASRDAPGS